MQRVVVARLAVRHHRWVQNFAPAVHRFRWPVFIVTNLHVSFAEVHRSVFVTVVVDAQRDRFWDGHTTFERFAADFHRFTVHQTTSIRDDWSRGVLNRDGLSCAAAVAAVVRSRERTLNAVLLGTFRVDGHFLDRDRHGAAVVRGRSVVEHEFFVALSRVVCRDGQHWSRRVLDRDGLRGRAAVAAIVRGSERTRDRVVPCTITWRRHRLHRNAHLAAVVRGRSIVHWHVVAALHRVVGWH